MTTPEQLEKSAKAIDQLLRGALAGTLKKKEAEHLGPMVVNGIRMLEADAHNMRAKEEARRAAEEGRADG